MDYGELYEVLRKEKYSETLQKLDRSFVQNFSKYLSELREEGGGDRGMFGEGIGKSKQLENSIALFKNLVLIRKKKLLNLVFVAAETGIMKRDFENMLEFEKGIFEKLVSAFEEGDKELGRMMNGMKRGEEERSKMVVFGQNVEEFLDMNGNVIGPFKEGELANLDFQVCEILVSGGKARFVDE